MPLLIIDDIELLDNESLQLISDSFNKRIRKSSLFKKCRFLFSAKILDDRIIKFFAKFGFDKISEIMLSIIDRSVFSKSLPSDPSKQLGKFTPSIYIDI